MDEKNVKHIKTAKYHGVKHVNKDLHFLIVMQITICNCLQVPLSLLLLLGE